MAGESLELTQTLSGRLRNFPLAPSPDNALYGLYEAISNSLHAIRDTSRPDTAGMVQADVSRDGDGAVDGFVVIDNGVGLNDANFASFRKIDSTFKAVRGGKGVGRLTWLKIFDHIRIESTFEDEAGSRLRRTFRFVADDQRPIQDHLVEPALAEPGTRIEMSAMKEVYKSLCPRRSETIVRSIIRHFLRDVISKDLPGILVNDDGISDVKAEFRSAVEREDTVALHIDLDGSEQNFAVTHLVISKAFADHDEKENAVYLLGHGRVVARRPVSGLIGLSKLQGGRTYIGMIEGDYLDDAVSQERTMLTAQTDIVDRIVRHVAEDAVNFLRVETEPLRERQLVMVKQIKREYPRFMGTLSEEREFVEKRLPLSVRDQELVFRAVSLDWYRAKRKVDRSIRAGLSNPKNDEEFQIALGEASKSIATESKAILADYVAERKVVIDFLERLVKKVRTSSDDNYELEARVHDLILPRKANSSNIKVETHNLWLIDERLPYYYYFNSDLPLSTQIEGSGDRRRPDITLSDVASAFCERGNSEPFIIVEFKRPGRENYSSGDDPIKQCLDYVAEFRSGKKTVNAEGAWSSTIQENTIFYCYIIADVTPKLREFIDIYDMKTTPDGRGHFKYHEKLRAWCEVIPYDKLIETSRVRHNNFFEKLGLT